MGKKIIILLCLACRCFIVLSADIVVQYTIKKDPHSLSKHAVSDFSLGIVPKAWDNFDLSSKQKVSATVNIIKNTPQQEVIIIKYAIGKSGVYFIQDVGGHQILLDISMVGDTIALNLDQDFILKKNAGGRLGYFLNDSISTTKGYNIIYPDKYKYIGFFDELAKLHGDLWSGGEFGNSFKELDHNLNIYLQKTNRVYNDRMAFYTAFLKKNGMPKKLQYYTAKEIQYCYYRQLLEPLLQWDAALISAYPKGLRDSLNKIGNDLNNQDLFANTSFYRSIITDYGFLSLDQVKPKGLNQNPDSAYFSNRLAYTKTHFKAEIKEYFLGYLMWAASNGNLKSTVALLYKEHNPQLSTPGTDGFMNKLSNAMLNKLTIPADEMLKLTFEDKYHHSKTLKNIINKKLIIIDCWATWCIPCRQQIPALDSIATVFKNDVQFISLSADQSISKWDNWLAASLPNGYITQLHAAGDFRHPFFNQLMIRSIPRYLLLNNKGEILNSSMPMPTDKELFVKEINKHLKTM